ncbi:MAG: PilW family protein [Planctomycetota bacterium]|jgi:prepilin-type N-terminal cleavage/methylation domain-containing protein
MKTKQRQSEGFTLVELLMALMIASIVLAAVVTLAGATAAANDATDEMGREQGQLRQVSMRLTDLIRRANRVTLWVEDGFELWHDNNADGLSTADELTQVTRGSGGNTLTIGANEAYTKCKNISFGKDADLPDIRFITVSFYITENGQIQKHSVNARLWVSDAHRKF